jgi:anti-sigma regulatory factor (Ser/Thr protein kinase)
MDEYTSMVQVWELLCPGVPEEVSRARRWTRDVLSGCPAAEDAELIVSELGTNAVTHTTSRDFRVTIRRTCAAVTITVTDRGDSASTPHLTAPYDNGTHGRGLAVVTQLAADVRVTGNLQGHVVAAHLPTEVAPC